MWRLVLLSALVPLATAVCDLPPDFWCDHPKIAFACTGSLAYCDGYRAARAGKPLKLRLAFESGCPDSQQFVVQRLYPQLLSQASLRDGIDFKALPWGLAKREFENRVRCHHGPRECAGNRLLSCSLFYYLRNPDKGSRLLNCFMARMMYKPPPVNAMTVCLEQLQTPPEAKASILHCAESAQGDELQKQAELETQQVLSTPRFVPFIAVNDRSHIHMQAYQLFLGDKVRMWNHTLALIAPTNARPSRCTVPSDFWCSDPTITSECFDQTRCNAYRAAVWGKPLHLKVVYDSSIPHALDYVLHYVRPTLARDHRVLLEVEPTPHPRCDAARDSDCFEHALQECVASKVRDVGDRTKLLLCLLDAKTDIGMKQAWNTRCHFLTANFDPKLRDSVTNCASSTEWKTYSAVRSDSHRTHFAPDPKTGDPWLVINGHSLHSAQAYQRLLHHMICLWYNGPNHDRDACSRCEYEATHC